MGTKERKERQKEEIEAQSLSKAKLRISKASSLLIQVFRQFAGETRRLQIGLEASRVQRNVQCLRY